MQGIWSTHRKAKLNLNAVAVPLPIMSIACPSDASANAQSLDRNPVEEPSEAGPSAIHSTIVVSSESRPPNSKRRPRTGRVGEESSKRIKVGSADASLKHYAPPSARLSDLGGIEASVEKMLELVAMPLCHPEIYLHTGVQPPRGVLLHGPPGCGKTLLANAIAGVGMKCTTSSNIPDSTYTGTWRVFH